MRKTVQTISVSDDAFPFNIVKYLAHLRRRVFVMIQKGNEVRNGALKIDVVFPKGVVRINEQMLGGIRCYVSHLS